MKQQPKAPTPTTAKRRIVRRFSGRMRLTAIALFVVTVVGAVMMLAASQPEENTATPEPLKLVSAPAPEPAAAAQPNRKTSPRKAAVAVVPAKATASPAAAAAPVAATAPETTTPPAGAVKGEVVTITGCLEQDNQEYRLTDTEGSDAPKARSWKSGFLKKRAANLEVLDAAKKLRLATHLGQRVTVTGVVAERKMEAWSLVVASRSCN
jgi:hypothetical protein